MPVPKNLIEAINEEDSYDNKFQVNNFDRNQSTVHDDQSNNNDDDDYTHLNDEDISKDESYDELNNLKQLDGIKSNEIVNQNNRNLSTARSCKSTSTSVKHAETMLILIIQSVW